MILAIPAGEKNIQSLVYSSFGRAPFFLFYNTKEESFHFVENDAAQSSGGAGIKAAQTIVDHQANTVLSPQCGQNAAEVLQGANIPILQSIQGSLQENIQAFTSGLLNPLHDIHEGHHSHGS